MRDAVDSRPINRTALGNANVSACTAGDVNGHGQITVDEILMAVNKALSGCGGS